jgi:dipeptidyl-peptidase 4
MHFRLALCLAILCPTLPAASELEHQLTRIFASNTFAAKRFGPARWIENGNAFTTVENSEIIRYQTSNGERSVLISTAQLTPAQLTPKVAKPLIPDDYHWSTDNQKLLIFTNTKKVWRDNTRGDYWVLDLAAKSLKQLGAGAPPASLLFAKFSPDAKRVAYVRGNNLYVEDLATGKITPLTTDGSDTLINGTSDWVYEEELFLRDAWSWSPDGRHIAFWQFDSSGVQLFNLIDNTTQLYPTITKIPYPKAGTTNSAVRIGVIPSTGGTPLWLDIPGDPRNHYLASMNWTSNNTLSLVQLNRLQNTAIVFQADASTGKSKEIFRDRDQAWIDYAPIEAEIPGGKSFLWLSERDGWRHAYSVPRQGGEPTLLTPNFGDLLSIQGLDPDGRHLYFIASPNNATQRHLYRSPLDRSSPPARLTPENQPGTHSYKISPDCRWAFHTYSTFDRPPVTELISLPSHKVVRTLEDNAALRGATASLLNPPVEFFQVPLDPQISLDGWMLKPRNFDPTKKYPVIVFVYGEPASVTVTDAWPGGRGLFHRALANQGYLVVSFDNRGTPAPKGRAWRKAVYGTVGLLSAQEQSQAILALAKSVPSVDLSRVGIWGWSGGGSNTLNALFRSPDLFKVGVSVAPVPDQTLYDTIYQERYMGLPESNPEGYRLGSPINFAAGLNGKLLLVHGSGDDNVHFQGSERLVNRLIELGKPFDFMEYPNRSHSISEGRGTSLHIHSLIARYFLEHLAAGPR